MGDKKIFSTRIDEDRIKGLKHLAVDKGRSLGNLLEEAIQDLLKRILCCRPMSLLPNLYFQPSPLSVAKGPVNFTR